MNTIQEFESTRKNKLRHVKFLALFLIFFGTMEWSYACSSDTENCGNNPGDFRSFCCPNDDASVCSAADVATGAKQNCNCDGAYLPSDREVFCCRSNIDPNVATTAPGNEHPYCQPIVNCQNGAQGVQNESSTTHCNCAGAILQAGKYCCNNVVSDNACNEEGVERHGGGGAGGGEEEVSEGGSTDRSGSEDERSVAGRDTTRTATDTTVRPVASGGGGPSVPDAENPWMEYSRLKSHIDTIKMEISNSANPRLNYQRGPYADALAGTSASELPGTNLFQSCQRKATTSWQQMKSQYMANDRVNTDGHEIGFMRGWNEFYNQFKTEIVNAHFEEEEGIQIILPRPTDDKRNSTEDALQHRCINESKQATTWTTENEANCRRYQTHMQNYVRSLKAKMTTIRQAIEEFTMGDASKVRNHVAATKKCWAALSLTTVKRELDKSDHRRKNTEVRSFDGKITCTDEGPETQDFFHCKDMSTAYDVAAVGHKAAETAGATAVMAHQVNTVSDLDPTDPTAGLKAQKASAEASSVQAHSVGGIELAIGSVFTGFAAGFPSLSSLQKRCQEQLGNDLANLETPNVQGFIAYIAPLYEMAAPPGVNFNLSATGLISAGDRAAPATTGAPTTDGEEPAVDHTRLRDEFETTRGSYTRTVASAGEFRERVESENRFGSDYCAVVVSAGLNLIANSRAQSLAAAAAAEYLTKGLANQAKGAILSNQADKIGDAIDAVKEFDPTIPTFDLTDDALVAQCQANPNLPECANLGFTQDLGFASNNISVSGVGNGTGTAISNGSGSGTSGEFDGTGGGTDRSAVPGAIGSIAGGINKGSGLESVAGSPGRLQSGGRGAGGGGGGGTPSGGGLSGGGGGGDQGKGGPSRAEAIKGLRVSDATSGLGKFRSGGGAGFASAKGGEEKKNPFADLFGKKGPEAGTGGTLNRNPAAIGSKDGSIFDTISKRYGIVSTSKRLEEYEQVK